MTIKCLTLSQPYATLVAVGSKRIDTRSWATTYRGPLAIHAAKGYGKGGKRGFHVRCQYEPFLSALEPHLRIFEHYNCFAAPLGAIVATCELVDCQMIGVLLDDTPTYMAYDEWPPVLQAVQEPERSFGLYEAGRYAWLLANVKALSEPIPCKGALGLWEPDTLTQMAIKRQEIAAL